MDPAIVAAPVRRRLDLVRRPGPRFGVLKSAAVTLLTPGAGPLARKAFAAGGDRRSARLWKATNELPFLAAIPMALAVTTEFPGGPGAAAQILFTRKDGISQKRTKRAHGAPTWRQGIRI